MYEGPEVTHFRGELNYGLPDMWLYGKWVSAIILIIRANFPRVQDPNRVMLRRAL